MAIPGITYRLEKGISVTHQEMDDNFRSVIYSGSTHDNGATLRLHYDTSVGDYIVIPLNAGSGSVTVTGNVDNRVITATGTVGLIQGEPNFLFDGSEVTVKGNLNLDDNSTNILIGNLAGSSLSGASSGSVVIGSQAGQNLIGASNTIIGKSSAGSSITSTRLVTVGSQTLGNLSSGNCNVAIGTDAGINVTSGAGNIYIGNAAGPAGSTAQSNKLYINNLASNTPLMLGDFSTGQVTFNSQVSASVFSGSFYGDGSGLTNLSTLAIWNGILEGNASITGSLTVTGSIIDFTQVQVISGSIFSGSFVGDGSGLTGITAVVFPYTGSAAISGSIPLNGTLDVTGTSRLCGIPTLHTNIKIHNPHPTSIAIGCCTYANSIATNSFSVAIGRNAAIAATNCNHVAIGNEAGGKINAYSVAIGYFAGRCTTGLCNTSVGESALSTDGSGGCNTAIGSKALCNNSSGVHNTGLGEGALRTNSIGSCNTAVGRGSLFGQQGASCRNVAVGNVAGTFLTIGEGNVYLGYGAGPTVNTIQSNKLYINNQAGTPLIGGDFSLKHVSISGSLNVSQSIVATTYYGNGSNLTGIEWDGSHNGNANITGSLTISGSLTYLGDTLDLTNLNSISGSIFSGSFTGDGSGLTGITAEWDGSRDGDANITGSLVVSGALDVAGTITIASTAGYPAGPGVELLHYAASGLSGVNNIYTFPISSSNGYTGFKADYVITSPDESSKKVGTLLGGWDQAANAIINDSYTYATGLVTNTSFAIDTSAVTSAILAVSASTGPYELNMLITAFKRSI